MKNLGLITVSLGLVVLIGFLFLNQKDETTNMTNKPTKIFLDVRTPEEWNAGHLDGAVHFELARLENGEMPDLPKDASIAVYCRSGSRAGQAKAIMEDNGFTNLRNAGGLEDLERRGAKICTGDRPSCN